MQDQIWVSARKVRLYIVLYEVASKYENKELGIIIIIIILRLLFSSQLTTHKHKSQLAG